MSGESTARDKSGRRIATELQGNWVFAREEVLLSIGALPLVLSNFGVVYKALEIGGWASQIVGYWLPVMRLIKESLVAALPWVLLPVSPAFQPLLAVALQLGVVVYFAFRRFGTTTFVENALHKFGWRRTVLHYPVHLAAFFVLLLYVLNVAHVSVYHLALPEPVAAGDWAVTAALAVGVGILLFWHPGISVRVLMVFLILLAFDWATFWIQSHLPPKERPWIKFSAVERVYEAAERP